jgi:hypothetical protein
MGDKLFLALKPYEPLRWEMFAESETDFFLEFADVQVTFVKDKKGQVDHLILHAEGNVGELKKVK